MSSVPAAAAGTAAPRPVPSAVAFCPCPPLLVPAVAGRAAEDTAALRAACATAVDALLASGPEVVVVVGGDGAGPRYGQGDGGDLRGYGVDLAVPFSGSVRPGGRRTPPAHTIGAWLLDAAGYAGGRLGVGPGDLAAALGDLPGTVAVLAMGDGSARRSLKAPGHLDDAAAPFDDAVAAALAAGDAGALAALDPVEGARLLAAGVPTWRSVGAALAGREVDARLHAHEAPFGVGYLVADWSVR
ncbi:hypothetical protein [Geodermatophilus sp. DSM 45219]|uniref:hypothetical protein n=1 Tax=Geodermatophilus sp. DSM 45219 TaxID=1881103 RepID=UPI000884762B|nr:hypothetical protein [Geodermatophilus sp. DSM 45219]SDO43509.1 hypothetical protein SAMN05428965_3911 [Geodermatophilus sp. DSM 45219]